MVERLYRCASCERETEAVVNNRKERRCLWCYAVLSDAMLIPVVVAQDPAAPPPGLPVEQEQKSEPVIEPEQMPVVESLTPAGKRRRKDESH